MAKSYLINLDGYLQERMEAEASKGVFNYTTIVKLALSEFFDSLDSKDRKIETFKLYQK